MPHIRYITDLSYYHDVPHDWLIAITDVKNSTIAIQSGKPTQRAKLRHHLEALHRSGELVFGIHVSKTH